MSALRKMDELHQYQQNKKRTTSQQRRTFVVTQPEQQLPRHGAGVRSTAAHLGEVWKKLEGCTIDAKKLKISNLFMCIGARSFLLNCREKTTQPFVDARVKGALGALCEAEAKTAQAGEKFCPAKKNISRTSKRCALGKAKLDSTIEHEMAAFAATIFTTAPTTPASPPTPSTDAAAAATNVASCTCWTASSETVTTGAAAVAGVAGGATPGGVTVENRRCQAVLLARGCGEQFLSYTPEFGLEVEEIPDEAVMNKDCCDGESAAAAAGLRGAFAVKKIQLKALLEKEASVRDCGGSGGSGGSDGGGGDDDGGGSNGDAAKTAAHAAGMPGVTPSIADKTEEDEYEVEVDIIGDGFGSSSIAAAIDVERRCSVGHHDGFSWGQPQSPPESSEHANYGGRGVGSLSTAAPVSSVAAGGGGGSGSDRESGSACEFSSPSAVAPSGWLSRPREACATPVGTAPLPACAWATQAQIGEKRVSITMPPSETSSRDFVRLYSRCRDIAASGSTTAGEQYHAPLVFGADIARSEAPVRSTMASQLHVDISLRDIKGFSGKLLQKAYRASWKGISELKLFTH